MSPRATSCSSPTTTARARVAARSWRDWHSAARSSPTADSRLARCSRSAAPSISRTPRIPTYCRTPSKRCSPSRICDRSLARAPASSTTTSSHCRVASRACATPRRTRSRSGSARAGWPKRQRKRCRRECRESPASQRRNPTARYDPSKFRSPRSPCLFPWCMDRACSCCIRRFRRRDASPAAWRSPCIAWRMRWCPSASR